LTLCGVARRRQVERIGPGRAPGGRPTALGGPRGGRDLLGCDRGRALQARDCVLYARRFRVRLFSRLMDNVTHTLIGVLVGETAATIAKPSSEGLSREQRRSLFVTMMAVGSNLPDLDFLYSTVTGSKLDYLLHHRGHTHTFVVSILIAAVLWLACELWARRRDQRIARSDRIALIAIALLAPVLHFFMDMANNYGVHPWWPFDNRWIYGDSVF